MLLNFSFYLQNYQLYIRIQCTRRYILKLRISSERFEELEIRQLIPPLIPKKNKGEKKPKELCKYLERVCRRFTGKKQLNF